MTEDETKQKALELALDGIEDMGRIERARVFLALASMRFTLWMFPRTLDEVVESVQENLFGGFLGLGETMNSPDPVDLSVEPPEDHAPAEKPCGNVHPLPCGVDSACPRTETDYDTEA